MYCIRYASSDQKNKQRMIKANGGHERKVACGLAVHIHKSRFIDEPDDESVVKMLVFILSYAFYLFAHVCAMKMQIGSTKNLADVCDFDRDVEKDSDPSICGGSEFEDSGFELNKDVPARFIAAYVSNKAIDTHFSLVVLYLFLSLTLLCVGCNCGCSKIT